MDELWVQPEYRRRGIARALPAKAEEKCGQLEATGLRLYVNTENPEARALCESCGYRQYGMACFMEKENRK